MSSNQLIFLLMLVGAWAPSAVFCQEAPYELVFKDQQIQGPATPSLFDPWIAAMRTWRKQKLQEIHFNGSNYDREQFQWTRRSFVQPQTMVEDRYLYDPRSRRYTVSRLLDDYKLRYGGIDSILIWPTYPNIGVDDRNTDDMIRSMPGGISGVRSMVADFHRAGVKVFFPIHPWDVGTRDPGDSWSSVLPKTMAEIGADGLNGDTMYAVTPDYFQASERDGHPLVLQPEIGLSGKIEQLGWNLMSWGYWDTNDDVPMVSVNKWLEPRHMVNVCDRWATDKTNILQDAFFNGVGIETWENVWSIWNGLSPRDSETIRRVALIEREFAGLLSSEDWEPHTPVWKADKVFASKWPGKDGSTLWTVVNRSDALIEDAELPVPPAQHVSYFDLWNGKRVHPSKDGDIDVIKFTIEPRGYAAVLVCRAEPRGLPGLLESMRTLAAKPLASFSSVSPILKQTLTPIAVTVPAFGEQPGMVRIPGGSFDFKVKGVEIEGEDMLGLDVQYPWEAEPQRSHRHTLQIEPFYIDRYPVTNAEYKRFIESSGYRPADQENYLKGWTGGKYPKDWGEKPVTWISLEDARSYAHWAGKRLPHEWEWQYAAGGADGRLYPWGSDWDESRVAPVVKSRSFGAPADVSASRGASPFGVEDLVGNVWQFTDEFTDDHTRAVILRGGSRFRPQGSDWYFPQAYRLDEHGKYLLMSPGRDRSGAIGFRCVRDSGAE